MILLLVSQLAWSGDTEFCDGLDPSTTETKLLMDLGISASVPYYNQTFLMEWETYRDAPVSTLLADIIQRSDMTDQRRRFVDLIRPPTFNLYVAGHPPPQADSIVSSFLVPGELVLVLTHSEARELFALPPVEDTMTASLPTGEDMLLPPLFRRQSDAPRVTQIAETVSSLMDIIRQPDGPTGPGAPAGVSLLLSMLNANRGLGEQVTPLQRINARYEHLLAEPRAVAQQEETGDEEILEQGVMRTLIDNDPVSVRGMTADQIRTPQQQQLANVMQTLNFMTGMLGAAGPAPVAMSSGVRKVINMETFNRVCPVVTQEEIAALTTAPPQEATPDESDMVGGSQDAGLGACSVCLSLLVDRSVEPGELRKMPNCIHKFHADCLAQWLTNNAISCPVCREPAVTETRDYGYLGYGTQEDEYTPADAVGAESSLPEWIPTFPARPTLGRVARRR